MKTVNMMIGAGLLCLVHLPIHAASKLPPTNGYLTAQVGAQCTTTEHGLAAIYLRDLNLANAMLDAKDHIALRKLLDSKSVIATRPGVTVHIMQRLGQGSDTSVEVRPAGQIGTLWMRTYDVECPVLAKPAKTSVK